MTGPLTDDEIEGFVRDGYVRLTHAFPRSLAEECCDLLWEELPFDRDDPSTWTGPVVRLWGSQAPAFIESATTPRLHAAFDQLVGPGRWLPKAGMGTFPVRFPSQADPGDTGWHIDGSVGPDGGMFLSVTSRGRALLLLFLYTDVTAVDAPTRIRRGSHLFIPEVLAPFGDDGVPYAESPTPDPAINDLEIVLATGRAGDVYLCHPFLQHAASFPHRGNRPRIIGQPALEPVGPLVIVGDADHQYNAVERAIRMGLARKG